VISVDVNLNIANANTPLGRSGYGCVCKNN